ncbi:unnamed protein product [Lampetra planeri]
MPAADIAALGNNNPRIQTHVLGAYSEGPLHSAVQEISIDLHGFKKAVDKKVEEMARQMGPLIKMINDLRDENMRLRAEQTRLAGRVEVLTKLLGVEDRSVAPLATVAPAAPSGVTATAYERPTSAAVALDGAGSQKSAFNTTLKIKLVSSARGCCADTSVRSRLPLSPTTAPLAGLVRAREARQLDSLHERRLLLPLPACLPSSCSTRMQHPPPHTSTHSPHSLPSSQVHQLLPPSPPHQNSVYNFTYGPHGQDMRSPLNSSLLALSPGPNGHSLHEPPPPPPRETLSFLHLRRECTRAATCGSGDVSGEGGGSHTTPPTSFKTPPGSQERQMGGRLELTRSQSLPRTPTTQSRKGLFQKLEQDASCGGGVPAGGKAPLQRSASASLPDATTIKQTILDWVRSKTDRYENVTIKNFSSSWCDGMAFCALVHSFFPEAFDFSKLSPQNPRHNFQLAFTCAEQLAHCDPLLDVDDMIMMGKKPDSKCVFTYVQSLYNKLRRLERMMEKAQQQQQ